MRQSGRYASPEDREILEDLGISVTDSDSPFGRWKKNREKEQASERERNSDRERNLERERFLDKEQTRDRDISLPPFGEEEFGYTASGNDSPAKQKGDKNGKAGKDKDMEKDLKTLIMQNKYEAAAVVLVLLFIIWYLVK